MKPAQSGAAMLVPATDWLEPFPNIRTSRATMETSGRFRFVVEPPLGPMSIPCWYEGIVTVVRMPPPEPGQPDSDWYDAPLPFIDRTVPPTTVVPATSRLSCGSEPYDPESPEARGPLAG